MSMKYPDISSGPLDLFNLKESKFHIVINNLSGATIVARCFRRNVELRNVRTGDRLVIHRPPSHEATLRVPRPFGRKTRTMYSCVLNNSHIPLNNILILISLSIALAVAVHCSFIELKIHEDSVYFSILLAERHSIMNACGWQ